jgi:hypothetical protein
MGMAGGLDELALSTGAEVVAAHGVPPGPKV